MTGDTEPETVSGHGVRQTPQICPLCLAACMFEGGAGPEHLVEMALDRVRDAPRSREGKGSTAGAPR